MRKTETRTYCDFCGCLCPEFRIDTPSRATPASLTVQTISNDSVSYMFDICIGCAKKLREGPLKAREPEVKNEQ